MKCAKTHLLPSTLLLLVLSFLSIFFFPHTTHATDLSNSIAGNVSDGSRSIPYRLFQPQGVAAGQKVPLILFLHGNGDCGTDNIKQTYWMNNLAAQTKSGAFAAYVLAPQLPADMCFSGGGTGFSNGSEAQALTLKALRQAMSNPDIDTSRIYITGVSMGSFGVWDIVAHNPTLFAAVVPMSGGGDPAAASIIKNIPIWAFHGSADDVVPVSSTRDMISALQAVGGNPKYTEVVGGNHYIWPPIYGDAGLYSWMFSQHVGNTGNTVVDVNGSPVVNVPVNPVNPPSNPVVPIVHTETPVDPHACSASQLCNPLFDKDSSLCGILQGLLKIAIEIGSILAVLFVIWSGFLFVTAQGNAVKLQAAKKTFYLTIAGIAVLLSASAIGNIVVKTVLTILGSSSVNICRF